MLMCFVAMSQQHKLVEKSKTYVFSFSELVSGSVLSLARWVYILGLRKHTVSTCKLTVDS